MALAAARVWVDRNILGLGREMRLSYLPPLMVYVAAGISGLTAIVGTFYVKERLGLSAEFLAGLAFWAGLPWALKVPLGHFVDLVWRWKATMVFVGAGLISASIVVMIGLLGYPESMPKVLSIEAWFVFATLLAPIGYVVQDVVADAMTVEAVMAARKSMNTTVQTLGRVAIIGGSVIISLANVYLLHGVAELPEAEKALAYLRVYELALVIPLVSVLGVGLGLALRWRDTRRLVVKGFAPSEARRMLNPHGEHTPINWWILGGGLAFAIISIGVGLGDVAGGQEIVFGLSMAVLVFLIWRITSELEPDARHVLVGTTILVFVFRAVPSPGAGATWWEIDQLGFDQQFLAELSLIGSVLTLAGLFIFRRFMAERSIAYVVGALTVAATVLSLPVLGMYYGLHDRARRHRARVAAGPDLDGADAGVDRELRPRPVEGDVLRGHGIVRELVAGGRAARDQVPEPDLHGHARSARRVGGRRDPGRLRRARIPPADRNDHRLRPPDAFSPVRPIHPIPQRLASGEYDHRRIGLRDLDGQAPRGRADLVQREVEDRVALNAGSRAHRDADADPRPDADPTAARAADADPDAGAAAAI